MSRNLFLSSIRGFLVICLGVFLSLIPAACQKGKGGDGAAGVRMNGEAPDFVLKGISGKDLKLSDLRGHVVFIEFFATWCPPCRETVPELINLQKKYGNRLIVLGIALDDDPDAAETVRKFTETNGLNYAVLLGTEKVSSEYNVIGIPRSVLIDKKGIIVQSYMGYVDNLSDLVSKKVDAII